MMNYKLVAGVETPVAGGQQRGSSCGCGYKINCQLALAVMGINTAGASPKSAQQCIRTEPREQVVNERGDWIIPA